MTPTLRAAAATSAAIPRQPEARLIEQEPYYEPIGDELEIGRAHV